ncbi:MAG: Sec-independent protein translocase protein TatB [Burkholderiaceae bacterium]|nr:Sec-independent protein translocase protein TatB [Burkholderiaceae bacterium]
MFDISFFELMMIGVVALVVLGPERLPKVARVVGQWVNRAQRYVNEVKADITREVDLSQLQSLKQQVQEAGQSIENSIRAESVKLTTELNASIEVTDSSLTESTITSQSSSLAKESSESEETTLSLQSTVKKTDDHSVLPALDPQLQRLEIELLSDEISKLEERLVRLRSEANTLRSGIPQA